MLDLLLLCKKNVSLLMISFSKSSANTFINPIDPNDDGSSWFDMFGLGIILAMAIFHSMGKYSIWKHLVIMLENPKAN